MKSVVLLASLSLTLALPSFAADPGKIAFSSNRSGNSEIWVMGADGSSPVNLTNTNSVAEGFPAWNPDGSQLTYARTDDIWYMNADGSGQTRIVVGYLPTEPAFRPNTDLISYSRYGGRDWDIYTIQPDGSNETRIIQNNLGDYSGRWNADGSKITFYTFNPSSVPFIYSANPNGTGQVQLTTAGGDRNPCWSPDGGRIVFQSSRDGNEEIYVMDADGTNQFRLTNNAAEDTRPVFSPDGLKIAFVSNRDGNNEIYVMNADGTNLVRLTNDPGDDNNPSWQQTLPAGAPSISIADVKSVTEGNSGTTDAVFALTLSAASATDVTVTYQAYAGTALAGQDYTDSGPGTVIFGAGETVKSITIPVISDALAEDPESFSVRISASGATIGRQQAIANIADDDPLPILALGGISKAEGNTGTTVFNVPLTLNSPAGRTVSVQYTTANGTATAGSDYVTTSGTLNIPAGQTSAVIPVDVTGDGIQEQHETFLIKLTNPVNAKLLRPEAASRILNDDKTPGISISDASTAEGGTATFTITLSEATGSPVTVNYATTDGDAEDGIDYVGVSGIATIPAGQTSVTVDVATLDDTEIEADEVFALALSDPTNAVLEQTLGIGTITSEDLPEIFAGDVTIREGHGDLRFMLFTVWLSEPAPFCVYVDVVTADGTAREYLDYLPFGCCLDFLPGETTREFIVPVIGERVFEPNENFLLKLSNASNGIIVSPQARGTLINDDVQPTISIGDVTVAEGNINKTITFTLTLSTPSWQAVTVKYATANDTATAGSDYTTKSGAVVFAAGETSKTITVLVNGDTVDEGDETFLVNLNTPTNATIKDGQGVATLTNDDASARRSARQN